MKRHLAWIAMVAACVFFGLPAMAQDQSAQGQTLEISLDQAIEIALDNNEKGKIAAEEIEKAKMAVMEYRSPALPSLTAIAGYTYNIFQPKQEMDFSAFNPLMTQLGLPPMEKTELPLVYNHEWNFTASLNQNIYTFGRIGSAIKMAKTYEAISEVSAKLTEQDVIYEVQTTYFGLVLAKRALSIAEENFKISQEHYNTVKAKYEAGLRSEFDLLQSKANLASTKPQLIGAQTAVELSKKALAASMGLKVDRDVDAVQDFTEYYPTKTLDELLGTARSTRKDLAIVELQTEMSKTTSKLYISNYLPVLAAQMNYTWSGISATEENQFWPESGDENWRNFWSVGVTFTWPIFDGLESYAKIRQYRSEERISRLQKTQLIKGIELEMTQIVREFESMKQQVQATEETVTVAEKAFELASIRYENGLGTALEKSDARLMMMGAKMQNAQALYQLNVLRARLWRTLGKDPLS